MCFFFSFLYQFEELDSKWLIGVNDCVWLFVLFAEQKMNKWVFFWGACHLQLCNVIHHLEKRGRSLSINWVAWVVQFHLLYYWFSLNACFFIYTVKPRSLTENVCISVRSLDFHCVEKTHHRCWFQIPPVQPLKCPEVEQRTHDPFDRPLLASLLYNKHDVSPGALLAQQYFCSGAASWV